MIRRIDKFIFDRKNNSAVLERHGEIIHSCAKNLENSSCILPLREFEELFLIISLINTYYLGREKCKFICIHDCTS